VDHCRLTANELPGKRDFDGGLLLRVGRPRGQKASDKRESDDDRTQTSGVHRRRRIYHDLGLAGTSDVRTRSADKKVVQPMLLLATLMLSVGLSLAISRIFLGCVLHVMAHGGLPAFHWRPVIFVTALFWMWYLTPAIAASHAATRVIQLLLH
jgi:hypothetical protein